MKKVLFTIIGAMAIMANMTSCGITEKVEFEEPIKAVYNKTFCCPTEPETKQITRKIRESGYADKIVDIENKDSYYDINKECMVREIALKFENVNGFDKYTKTVYVYIQPTEKYWPGETWKA